MRWLAILLAGLLCFVMTSCPGGEEEDNGAMTSNTDDGGGDGGDWGE